jgi:hypothetical protein
MNLQAIASAAIQSINPDVSATWLSSTGYTTAADGSRTPTTVSVAIKAQVQALSGPDLEHVAGLNLQGVVRAAYLTGDIEGIVRDRQMGGDKLIIGNQTWLVAQVLEAWPDWTKVVIVLQNA